jgi:hypothetical protein
MCAERHLTRGRGIKLKAAEQNFSAFTKDTSLYKCRPDIDAKRESRGLAPLPVGWRARSCPECGSIELVGALISDSADRFDPDIICMVCGYHV